MDGLEDETVEEELDLSLQLEKVELEDFREQWLHDIKLRQRLQVQMEEEKTKSLIADIIQGEGIAVTAEAAEDQGRQEQPNIPFWKLSRQRIRTSKDDDYLDVDNNKGELVKATEREGVDDNEEDSVEKHKVEEEEEEEEVENVVMKMTTATHPSTAATSQTNRAHTEAETLYLQGTALEQEGMLGEAIRSYRKALKMDPNVERSLGFMGVGIIRPFPSKGNNNNKEPTGNINNNMTDSQKKSGKVTGGNVALSTSTIHHSTIPSPSNGHHAASNENNNENANGGAAELTLKSLIRSLLESKESLSIERNYPELAFRGSKQKKHMSDLPSELLSNILFLAVTREISNLPSIARVCKVWLLCAYYPSFWRNICLLHWTKENAMQKLPLYNNSWLKMYQTRPRIRYEGVYISRVNYIRQGLNEGSYFTPILNVTYYRYLRFFPDGTVLSLLANDPPQVVVPTLTKSSQKCYFGKYSSKEHLDAKNPRITIKLSVEPVHNAKYSFKMELELRSSYLGGSNKISWSRYYSVDMKNIAEITEYPLDQLRNYYFSPVRHYTY